MIWAAMSSAGVGPLCFLKSTVNAVGLVRIPFFELRSFGSNEHRIFEASKGGAGHILLSNKGRNLCASVCLYAFVLY